MLDNQQVLSRLRYISNLWKSWTGSQESLRPWSFVGKQGRFHEWQENGPWDEQAAWCGASRNIEFLAGLLGRDQKSEKAYTGKCVGICSAVFAACSFQSLTRNISYFVSLWSIFSFCSCVERCTEVLLFYSSVLYSKFVNSGIVLTLDYPK